MKTDSDIWMVVFDDEVELYLLETNLYFYNLFNETAPINVIINELDYHVCESISNRLSELDLSISLTIYHADEILTESEFEEIKKFKTRLKSFEGFGWIVQQYLKLLIHRKSTKQCSYIFDCKNIPIRKGAIDNVTDFHNFEGSGSDGSLPYNDFKLYLQGKGILKDKSHSPRSVMTPFIFETSVLKRMDIDLDIFQIIFSSIINPDINYRSTIPLVSEIILYYAYIACKREHITKEKQKHINWHVESEDIFKIMEKHSTFESLIRDIKTRNSPKLCTVEFENLFYVSIHRHMLKNNNYFNKFKKFIERVKNSHRMS